MNLVDSLEGQLRLKDFKLNSLLDITTAINSNQNVDDLLNSLETYCLIILQSLK